MYFLGSSGIESGVPVVFGLHEHIESGTSCWIEESKLSLQLNEPKYNAYCALAISKGSLDTTETNTKENK